ncbi:hypothetical protein HPCPY1962_1318 [Helicobacter pylori CPY1962]|nr:hypothetical protein HPCPY1962_1318 [Helicobacter pylori CPY1962]
MKEVQIFEQFNQDSADSVGGFSVVMKFLTPRITIKSSLD